MSREEYEAVQTYISSSSDPISIDRVTRQAKWVDLGDGVSVEMCRYRDMEVGGCAVYSARPLVCKLLGHVEWMPCPIEKVKTIASTADALELMKAYAQVERRTFEGWASIGETQ